VRDMPKRGYTSVTIPDSLGSDIEKIKRMGHGYRSKSDVVEDAVRRLLLDLQKQESKAKEVASS